MAMAGVLGLAVTAYVALRASFGLSLDESVWDAVGATVLIEYVVQNAMRGLSKGLIAMLLLAFALLALVRHTFSLVLGAATVIGGAIPTTYFLQYELFTRPEVSPGVNGLPSNRMTVALSVALAAVIVAPTAWRSMVTIGGSAAATLVGVALVLGRWHRLTDVIAATFVCVAWAAAGLMVAGLGRRRPPATAPTSTPMRTALALVGSLAGAWTASVFLVLWGTQPPPGLPDLALAVFSLGFIGLACAFGVTAVAGVADRHLG